MLNSADISYSISSIFFEVLSACISGCNACAEAFRTWRVAVLPNKPKIFTFDQIDGEKRRQCEPPSHAAWTVGGSVQIRINVPVAITTMRVAFVKQCDLKCRIFLTWHQIPRGVATDAASFGTLWFERGAP